MHTSLFSCAQKSANSKKWRSRILSRKLLFALMLQTGWMHADPLLAQVPQDAFNYTRISAFTYDPDTGLLLSETVEPGNPDLCVSTTYTYDRYGNKRSTQTSNCAGASGPALFAIRTSVVAWDAIPTSALAAPGLPASLQVTSHPAGYFPSSLSNALNQSENRITDPRFGKTVALTGPNGLTTTWQTDGYGRTVQEIRADHTSTVTYYCFIVGRINDLSSNSANCPSPALDEIPAEAVSFIHTEGHDAVDLKNGPFSRTYVDRAGRKLRTATEAFDGNTQPGGTSRLIVQDTDYNISGVAQLSTQPYFLDTLSSTATSGGGYGLSTTSYDALGRPVAIYHSDPQGSQSAVTFGNRGSSQAALTRISYNGLMTTITNDQGQSHVEEKNIGGQLIRITDALGGQLVHQYDAFGNLLVTKDALQNRITVSYDLRGRKLSMNDPDKGRWTYVYNALGELVQEQSPKHQQLSTNTSYDLLGRMTQRVEPEYVSRWYYDTYANGTSCAMGIGKLCESSTSAGLNRKTVYDSVGRAIHFLTRIDTGPAFASSVSYDNVNGRISSQTYPTGLTVNYAYTGKGYLQTLSLGSEAEIKPLPAAVGSTVGATTVMPAGSLLWQAQAQNAWGQIEQQAYGNNVFSQTGFDAITGRLINHSAGYGGSSTVTNLSYAWDSLNHLVGRTDANGDGSTGAVTDSMIYDSLGRLQSYTVASPSIADLHRTVRLQYNALGSILFKSDVGIYSYPDPGTARPHALQSVSGNFNSTYAYDDNGNLTESSGSNYIRTSYTTFNLPGSQTGIKGSSGTYEWQYDENHQRIKETRVNASGTTNVWMLHPDNAGGLSFESEDTGREIFNRHFVSVGGNSIAMLVSTGALPVLAEHQTTPNQINTIGLIKVEYWHKDHLGSLIATTDHTGAVTARYSYDPFGKRRKSGGNVDMNGLLTFGWSLTTDNGSRRGYTGHEHLDDLGLVHMNGRIYDPVLGVFLQGDPVIQDPTNLQNYNRYGYCYNNPMSCTDPSGFCFMGCFWQPKHWGSVGRTLVAAVAAYFTYGYAAEFFAFGAELGSTATAISASATSGFVAGAITSGNAKGAVQGAFSAATFAGVGEYLNGNGIFSGTSAPGEWSVQGVALHGVVGCVASVSAGAKCGPGFLSAAFSQAALPFKGNDPIGGTISSAVIGGTASVLGGGKFANGAQTASFGYLFNYCMHDGHCTTTLEKTLWDWMPGYKIGTCISVGNCTATDWTGAVGETVLAISTVGSGSVVSGAFKGAVLAEELVVTDVSTVLLNAEGRGGVSGAERFFDALPRTGNVTVTETPLGIVRSMELEGGGTASMRPFSKTNPAGATVQIDVPGARKVKIRYD